MSGSVPSSKLLLKSLWLCQVLKERVSPLLGNRDEMQSRARDIGRAPKSPASLLHSHTHTYTPCTTHTHSYLPPTAASRPSSALVDLLPTYVVLRGLGYEPDSFKNVRNVVYPSLLYLQRVRGLVQVKNAVGRRVEEVAKLLCQRSQRCLGAALGRQRRPCTGRKSWLEVKVTVEYEGKLEPEGHEGGVEGAMGLRSSSDEHVELSLRRTRPLWLAASISSFLFTYSGGRQHVPRVPTQRTRRPRAANGILT